MIVRAGIALTGAPDPDGTLDVKSELLLLATKQAVITVEIPIGFRTGWFALQNTGAVETAGAADHVGNAGVGIIAVGTVRAAGVHGAPCVGARCLTGAASVIAARGITSDARRHGVFERKTC